MKFAFLLCSIILASLVHSQNNEGTVTVLVKKYCEIIVHQPDRPIHFTCNRRWQHKTKHVQVISNCDWTLSVRPKGRYLYCNHYKIDGNLISYRITNSHGTGEIHSPEASYELYQTPYHPPYGSGSVEFDVVFSLDTDKIWRQRWGNYNTKVDITCTPDTN